MKMGIVGGFSFAYLIALILSGAPVPKAIHQSKLDNMVFFNECMFFLFSIAIFIYFYYIVAVILFMFLLV